MKQYDVAIIGLGPAGAILARHLGPELSVIALDKKRTDGSGFQKPCGGMLAPDAQKAFARFNMTLPKDVLVDPQIFSVKTVDLKADKVRYYQRHYINMDRARFDRWLIDMIPPRVEVVPDAVCVGARRIDGGFEVTYVEGGCRRTLHARYVVGADGANSALRRALYPGFKIRTFLSIQQWFKAGPMSPSYACFFDPDITDSYAWGLTKDGHYVFGGAFDIETGRQDFEALKQKVRPYGPRLEQPVKTEACLVLRPFGPRNYCLGGQGAFFIGEAAGFISPTSLEGISYAVASAYMLSQCLHGSEARPEARYRLKTRSLRLKLVLKYMKHPFMYHPLLRRLVMGSGVASIKMAEGFVE